MRTEDLAKYIGAKVTCTYSPIVSTLHPSHGKTFTQTGTVKVSRNNQPIFTTENGTLLAFADEITELLTEN